MERELPEKIWSTSLIRSIVRHIARLLILSERQAAARAWAWRSPIPSYGRIMALSQSKVNLERARNLLFPSPVSSLLFFLSALTNITLNDTLQLIQAYCIRLG